MNREQQDVPFVSVIIPVFNDHKRLQTCLAALERQSYPSTRYEVVVVDNGSTTSIMDVVSHFPHAVAVDERCPGSYAARNTGLEHARGEVIAFTDSDCIPAVDWIESGVRCLCSNEHIGLIAGRVNLFYREPARPTPVELYERVTAFPQQKFVQKYHFGATANVFARKRIFNAVGPFNATLKSGGDREWGQRVHAAGYELVYADDVCVAHPARHTLGELYQKSLRTAGGLHDLASKRPVLRFAKGLLKDLVHPWKDIKAIVSDSRLLGLKQKLTVVVVTFCVRYMQVWIKILFQFSRPARQR